MWGSFLLCVGVFILALYLPGYAFFRSLRVSRIFSLGCAPIYSIAMYALLPILYQKAGISCNWAVLFIPALLLALALLFVLNRRRSEIYGVLSVKRPWAFFALYLIAGIAACWFILVSGLGDFDTFYNRPDNAMHLNAVRACLDSGNWSSLGLSQYNAASQEAIPYDTGWGFYPGAWHDTVALVVSLTGIPETIVINAFNAIVAGIVYPLCMFVLMATLFDKDQSTLLAGSVVTPAINAFPWYLFLKGPLSGNMLSFTMVPAVCALFIFFCRHISKQPRPIIELCLAGLFSFAALALSQPNGLFTFYVFASAFLGHRLKEWIQAGVSDHRLSKGKAALIVVAFLLAIAAIWIIAYKLPAFRDTIRFRNAPDNGLDPINALYDTLSLGFVISLPQWFLAALALVGVLILVVKKRSWMVFPPAFFAVAYFCARAFYDRRPRQFIAGFWYSDPTRLAASMTLFLVPLISLGLSFLIKIVIRLLRNLSLEAQATEISIRAKGKLTALLLAAFCTYAYFPNYTPDIWAPDSVEWTPIGTVKQRIAIEYNTQIEQVYSTAEREFVKQVETVLPEGALVLNHPFDGSLFAYGLDDLNTYFRVARSKGYSENADIIRQGIDAIALNSEVQDAVKKTGAEYLLLLDQGDTWEDGKWLGNYYKSDEYLWDGFNRITDDTPGLEVVLADGDMRLYKITAVDGTEKDEG